jgi:hypothetical protein
VVLVVLGHGILVLGALNCRSIGEMTTLRHLTVEEVTRILSRGAFAELISAVEHVQFECKGGFYDTKSAKGKIELAKDVSALANSSGGYLLIGPATTKNPLHQGDEVTSVSDFASSTFQPDTYRDILTAYIYPPIAGLKIQWHASGVDPTKGIASIYVPPKSTNDKPFLVVQSEIAAQVRGHLFGYFERVDDAALPTSVQVLRDTMKDGKRYGDLVQRIENLEGLVTKLVTVQTVKNSPLDIELLLRRAEDAKAKVELSDVPSFFLIAAPTTPIKLSGLFSTQSAEYKAISEPPVYRQNGFDLNSDGPVQHLRGELVRRVVRGRKGLELWQDGTLIFVGRNDEDFLGWAWRRQPAENNNIYINNFVLTEVISLFLTVTIQIFSGIQYPPENIKVCFGLKREDLSLEIGIGNKTYELSSRRIDPVLGSYSGRKVAAEDMTFWIDFTLKDAIPEIEALKLLKEIYHWFGITDEQIPYVDSASVPQRVDRTRYT